MLIIIIIIIFFFEKISEWLLLKVGWDEICMFITYLVFLANVLLKKFKHTEVALHFVHKQYFLKKEKKKHILPSHFY